jgi:hypothetical protein
MPKASAKEKVAKSADEEMQDWVASNTKAPEASGTVRMTDEVFKESYQVSPDKRSELAIPGMETPQQALEWAADIAKDNVFIRDTIVDMITQMEG